MSNFVTLTKIEEYGRTKMSVVVGRVNWIANGMEGSILNIGGESFPVEESREVVLALLSRAIGRVEDIPLAVVDPGATKKERDIPLAVVDPGATKKERDILVRYLRVVEGRIIIHHRTSSPGSGERLTLEERGRHERALNFMSDGWDSEKNMRAWLKGIRKVADEACSRFMGGRFGSASVPFFRDIEQRASKALKGEE